MSIPVKEKGYGNVLSAILSTVFLILIGLALYAFDTIGARVESLQDITVWEFVLLALAVFRLTRLFVYDSVSQWIRDIFLDVEEVKDPVAEITLVYRSKPEKGIRRLFADLLSCPWCTGVWISLVTTFVYLMYPSTWFLWLMMAIAGVATVIQISANAIGWHAEIGKLTAKEMEDERGEIDVLTL